MLEAAENLSGITNIIAVTSGKGGVGKSTVAANLAAALAQSGAEVGLLDADIYGPSIGKMFNIHESPAISKLKKIQPVTIDGIRLFSGAMFSDEETALIWRGSMVSQIIQGFLQNVAWGNLDYLLIDLPPGTGDVQLTIIHSVPLTGVIIVTTPQEMRTVDARKGIFMYKKASIPVLGIIENMSYFICNNCKKKHYLFQRGSSAKIADSSGIRFYGEIPVEAEVSQCGDEGMPVTIKNPESAVSLKFMEISNIIKSQMDIQKDKDGNL